MLLTFNEAKHLPRALASVRDIASEIFVIDSGSTDGTQELARSMGASVLQNAFVNHAQQFQWGMDNAPITADWVMRLDADEIVEPDLVAEIKVKLPQLPPEVTGVNLKRKIIFMGRWLRFGGRYPQILLRIWRTGKGRIEQRWMDEHMLLTEGRAVTFTGGFSDHNLNDLTFFTNKHNKYATREALDILNQQLKLFPRDEALGRGNTSMHAASTRFLKERFYNKLPFEFSTLGYFVVRYFLQLGFLDGREGAIYHFLQGYWYRFLVGSKVEELRRGIAHLSDPAEIRKELASLTGHTL
ncbi:glycosyltransferase family 2 protein [Bosea vaviloviae]|uniref:glycosyltransferase family 2 protein n=1 Tax=Bosea vaviloviae TaxID=1526658 RepID=UPI000A934E1F|nr:glycosyltransferase family 2 protein [Bosea vaviloviae]